MMATTLLHYTRHFGNSDCRCSDFPLNRPLMPNFEPQVAELSLPKLAAPAFSAVDSVSANTLQHWDFDQTPCECTTCVL